MMMHHKYLIKALPNIRFHLEQNTVYFLLDQIGLAYYKTHQQLEALKYLEESLELKKTILPAEHPNIANSLK